MRQTGEPVLVTLRGKPLADVVPVQPKNRRGDVRFGFDEEAPLRATRRDGTHRGTKITGVDPGLGLTTVCVSYILAI